MSNFRTKGLARRTQTKEDRLNNFENVMTRQLDLMERFLESSGSEMIAGKKKSAVQHSYNILRPHIGNQHMPIYYESNRIMSMYGNRALKARKRTKAAGIAGPVVSAADHHPLYEIGFFQDCALDPTLYGMMVQPNDSIINMIPVRANNTRTQKFGFITAYNVTFDTAQVEPTEPCDPCLVIDSNFEACKISFPYGRICRRTKTLEVNELIRRACAREYDDFMFVGDLRGQEVFPAHFGLNSQSDEGFIRQSAVRRKLFDLGRYFQLYMMPKVWTGDPANNISDAYMEFYGLANLIRDDYGELTNTLPIETYNGADCSELNSDIKNFNGRCLNDPGDTGAGERTIWQYLQEMESTLYLRAQRLGALPVQWAIFMLSTHWNELVKVLPCQMAGDGCNPVGGAGTLMVNDGGTGMFNLAMREQMLRSQTLTLNGRTYPIIIDDTMPYELTPANTTIGQYDQQYKADIWFIPFTGYGQELLYWEHMDYSVLDQALAPIPGSVTDLLGWSDGGRFHHSVTMERWCYELQSKFEARLIFRAPHLAGRIQNVVSCPMQRVPFAFDGAGNYDPTLGGI